MSDVTHILKRIECKKTLHYSFELRIELPVKFILKKNHLLVKSQERQD